jgi:hypothetical protein
VRQLGRLGGRLDGHDGRSLDRSGIVVGAEWESERRPGPASLCRSGPIPEAGLIVAEPVLDVVAFQRLGRFVGTDETNTFSGIAMALLRALLFPVSHKVLPLVMPTVCGRASRFRHPSCTRGRPRWWRG